MSQTDDEREQAFILGEKAAWRRLLQQSLAELGDDAPDGARLALERAAVVANLRELCAEFGDNDWPDSLHLVDVIENHLARHLRELIPLRG